MAETRNFFADSAAYDAGMGRLSRVAGGAFLDWLSLPGGLRWLDVGCGTGSFTDLLLDRAAPGAVCAVDPSPEQIAFVRTKPGAARADYRQGDAMSLPYGDGAFDVAVMALVIQYVPDRAKAMSEMVRVVRRGGTVAAYVWPGPREGHPMRPLYDALESMGASRSERPGNQIRTIESLVDLFAASGLADVDSRAFDVRFVFDDFDDYWSATSQDAVSRMTDSDLGRLKSLLRERLPPDGNGRISYGARANAVRGRKPA